MCILADTHEERMHKNGADTHAHTQKHTEMDTVKTHIQMIRRENEEI